MQPAVAPTYSHTKNPSFWGESRSQVSHSFLQVNYSFLRGVWAELRSEPPVQRVWQSFRRRKKKMSKNLSSQGRKERNFNHNIILFFQNPKICSSWDRKKSSFIHVWLSGLFWCHVHNTWRVPGLCQRQQQTENKQGKPSYECISRSLPAACLE